MLEKLTLAVALPAALMLAVAPAGATMLGDTMNISVSVGGPPLATNPGVLVVDPGVEVALGDASPIDTVFFTPSLYDAASIDVQPFDILINLDVNDAFSGAALTTSSIFIFDLVDFQGAWAGLPIGSVGLGSDDPYFATARAGGPLGCTLTDCVDFDGNTIQVEILSNSINPFTYRLQPTPVPEPGTFVLFGAGLLGAAFLRRRR